MRDPKATDASRQTQYLFEQAFQRREAPLARRAAPRQPQEQENAPEPSGEPEGLYIISVAAKMLSMHPQTLRKYERAGLVRPSRTVGMLRLYSNTDITRLRIIKHLVDELRLNLAGVETVLHMVERLGSFPSRVAPLSGSRRVAAALERELDSIFEMLQGRVAPPEERAK
ncbi:MAG: MerR family transcriptional regulator [Dehalococcoidia bacterium]|nr:MerR family transcriptional regulator [Dehalococcoidia bacterium]